MNRRFDPVGPIIMVIAVALFVVIVVLGFQIQHSFERVDDIPPSSPTTLTIAPS